MTPHVKLYLSSSKEEGVFGDGKWFLLDALRMEGNIQSAVARLDRSYRKAWSDIKKAEKGLGRRLVVTSRGGRGGGEAVLTGFADKFLEAWAAFRKSVEKHMNESFAEHVAPLLTDLDKKAS